MWHIKVIDVCQCTRRLWSQCHLNVRIDSRILDTRAIYEYIYYRNFFITIIVVVDDVVIVVRYSFENICCHNNKLRSVGSISIMSWIQRTFILVKSWIFAKVKESKCSFRKKEPSFCLFFSIHPSRRNALDSCRH